MSQRGHKCIIEANCLNRFGISLAHEHFHVSGDKTIVEVCDVENRKLISIVMKKSKIVEVKGIETNWRLIRETHGEFVLKAASPQLPVIWEYTLML